MVKIHDWVRSSILSMIVLLASNLYGADLRKDLEKELQNLYEEMKYIIRNFCTGDRLKCSIKYPTIIISPMVHELCQ